VEAPQA
jgi:hypothetical protein